MVNKVEIIKHFGVEDAEFSCDYSTEIIFNYKSVFYGDQYHNKAKEYVEGFLKAFEILNIEYEIYNTKIADDPNWD